MQTLFLQYSQSVLATLGILSSVCTALYVLIRWLSKTAVAHYLELQKESYKAELEREKEAHRKDLERVAFVYQTKFSSLHAEQAGIIKRVYSLLLTVREVLNTLVIKAEQQQELKNFSRVLDDLKRYYFENRIYLSKGLSDNIEALVASMDFLGNQYGMAHAIVTQGGTEAVEFTRELRDGKRNINRSLGELEDAFRALLGASHPETPKTDEAG